MPENKQQKKTACCSGLSRHAVFLFIIHSSAATCYCRLHEASRCFFFQRCHMLLQITRSPTLLFFCSFLWLFLSYTRDFISLRVTDSHLPQSVFPGEFPRRKLNYLLIRRLAVKIEFTGGPPGPPKLFLVAFLLFLPLCFKSTTGADSIPCSGFPIQKQTIPTIFHRARTTCPLFSYTEYIASLNFCLFRAYAIARYSVLSVTDSHLSTNLC